MKWRKFLLASNMGSRALQQIKVRKNIKCTVFEAQTEFKFVDDSGPQTGPNKTYKYTREYDRLGDKVDIMFPLVTPNLSEEEQLEMQKHWYQLATADDGFLEDTNTKNYSIKDLVDAYPYVLPFVPSSKVLSKMI